MRRDLFIFIFIFILLLCNTGCRKKVDYYYYKDGSVFTETYENDSLNYIIRYYQNGKIDNVGYALKKNDNVDGHFEAYYPDGFPKEKCEMKDGIGIGRPAESGKKSGYDIRVDFGPYETLENGKKVRPFRVFIDSLPLDEYIITLMDTTFYDTFLCQMPKVMKQYTIYNEEKDSVNTVTIDETMYPFYIDDLQKITLLAEKGAKGFVLNFFYKSLSSYAEASERRMVVMHDSIHWKVADVKIVSD